MAYIIVLTIFYIFIPVFIIFLTRRFKIANKLGGIIIAYILGLALGHSGIIPMGSESYHTLINGETKATLRNLLDWQARGLITDRDILLFKVRQLQDNLMTLAVLIAIPLLLFSCSVKDWFRMAGKTFIALVTGTVAVTTVVVLGYFLFRDKIPDAWKVAGMLVGVYTGGTPNLAALKMMLDVNPDVYIMTHTYDTLVSAFFLFFLVTFGKTVFGSFLPSYPFKKEQEKEQSVMAFEDYTGIVKPKYLIPLLLAIGMAFLVVGASIGLSLLLTGELNTVIIILSITTLSILVSMIPRINRIEKTFETGMYFILIFSVVVASMANFRQLMDISGALFLYITLAVMGSLIVHAFLSWIFKVDADTLMIAHTALVCSPPFVPMVAGALRNREVILAGLTVGLIGYAMGNYLGFALAYLLKAMG
jgi:uncharacterized membrane protein